MSDFQLSVESNVVIAQVQIQPDTIASRRRFRV